MATQLASRELGILPGAENLRIETTHTSSTGTHIRACQTVQGQRLLGSELQLHFDQNGRLYLIAGRPFPEAVHTAQAASEERSSQDALRVVAQRLRLDPDGLKPAYESGVLLLDGRLEPVTHMVVNVQCPFATWSVLLHATRGILSVYNIASASKADVFDRNPFRDPSTRQVDLGNLLNGAQLVGNFADICAYSPNNGAGTRVQPVRGDYLFHPTSTEFDEPNLYHAIDWASSRFRALSPKSLALHRPAIAQVHTPTQTQWECAFFDPQSKRLCFGEIVGFNPPRYASRSMDIVLHEYGHWVSDMVCQLGQSPANNSSRALSEGYSDYFAASFLNCPVIGDYAENDAQGWRQCDVPAVFPAGYAGSEHAVGAVWAHFLWSLRDALPVGVADRLAFESLHFLGPFRTIPQGLRAIHDADRQLHPTTSGRGYFETKINDHFDKVRP